MFTLEERENDTVLSEGAPRAEGASREQRHLVFKQRSIQVQNLFYLASLGCRILLRREDRPPTGTPLG